MEGGAQTWVSAMRAADYPRAWAMTSRDLARRDPATRDDPSLPYYLRWVWDGRPFDGRDVLVRCYHGLGDTIQFARYLPALTARAASVTVEAPARLCDLIATVDAAITVVPFDHARPLPPAACDIEITELPFALRARPEESRFPYLTASPAALPPATIGLCHQGGDWDVARSLDPALLAPIAAAHRCITLVSEPSTLPVLNPAGCAFAMDATAALVAACDLVITVDTMIAHLAGALGRPTWLLLKAEPDWRWNPAATDTPWYPDMRLYVQQTPGDWAGVIARVVRDLSDHTLHLTQDERPAYGEYRSTIGSRVVG
ncbi:glycosyltransferase family 9 protein [Sphingomonas mucosissima]|uniref:Glycosyltransferase family 9 (Heptosyltransferase) n=1 Tax=Sphingomonas mucosissima TaxID=370959 RepID=A0A245ZMD1_9SPHN|nr:glycosyltransferase family 9 protein [Sphingomonas mucosissima]OWK30894.1 hypothetical protein SPMU_18840 [Sphingomonas mucosissima]